MITIMSLIGTAADSFETKKRDSGETFIIRKDSAPDWVADMCYAAHGGMMPDDWKYQNIAAILDSITDICEVDADLDDIREEDHEICDGLVDIYNSDLSAWLASHLERQGYVDEACREFGTPTDQDGHLDIARAMMQGQYAELSEIFHSILGFIETLADDLAA